MVCLYQWTSYNIDMKDKNEGNNGNDSKDNDEEIVLDLPSSNNDDDK